MLRYIIALILSLSSQTLLGATFTQFIHVQTGKFDDPNLEGFRTFAMRVVADTDWSNADLLIELDSGTLRHLEGAAVFGGTRTLPGPVALGETGVFSPLESVGDLTSGYDGPRLPSTQHTETPTSFEANWFNTELDDVGMFDIAMITISNDANGELRFRNFSDGGTTLEEGGYSPFSGFSVPIRDGCILNNLGATCIPEPAAGILVGLAALLWLAPRRFV